MWVMSALIQRYENFGFFYSFCSQLVVDKEGQKGLRFRQTHRCMYDYLLEGLLLS